MSKKIFFFPVIFVIFVMLVGLACGFSKKGDPTATPEVSVVAIPTEEPATEEPTEIQIEPGVGGLTLLPNFTFFQNDKTLTSVIFLRNDYPSETLMDIEYTVHAYDASGAQVDNTSNHIGYLTPGEMTGAVDEIWLDEGINVASIDVDWIIGDRTTDTNTNPFTVENAKSFQSSDWNYLTGVIRNNDVVTYSSLRVSGIAYDAAGNIIGGGYTYVDFIPDGDKVGVTVLSSESVVPDRVELYPQRQVYSDVLERGDWWNNVEVVDFGYVLNDGEVGGGMILKNVTDQLIKDTQFILTVYDKDNYVCGTDSDYVDFIWPGETLGFSSGATYVYDNCDPDTVDLIVMPGEFAEHELSGEPIVSDGAVFNYSEYWSTVTITLRNTLNKTISDAFVSVLLLDSDGNIIGGGSGWPEDFEALGTQEVEVFVTYASSTDPATIEVYPVITTWSEIGQ